MRKIVILAFVVALSMGFVACGDEKAQSSKDEVSKSAPLRVGATPVPAAEILEFIKPQLQAKGVEIFRFKTLLIMLCLILLWQREAVMQTCISISPLWIRLMRKKAISLRQ